MDKYGYIYMTTDTKTDKIYIGKRRGMFDTKYFGSGTVILNILKRHPYNRLRVELCEYANSKKELAALEKDYILYYRKTIGLFNVYNITSGGDGGIGSKSHKPDCTCGFCKTMRRECSGKDNNFFGKSHSKESKEVIGSKSKGRWAKHKHETCPCSVCKQWRQK